MMVRKEKKKIVFFYDLDSQHKDGKKRTDQQMDAVIRTTIWIVPIKTLFYSNESYAGAKKRWITFFPNVTKTSKTKIQKCFEPTAALTTNDSAIHHQKTEYSVKKINDFLSCWFDSKYIISCLLSFAFTWLNFHIRLHYYGKNLFSYEMEL